MDNNNFEQQFTQNLKAMPMQPAEASGSSKLPLVISVALAVIVIVQSIALIITLTNYFSIANGEAEYSDVEEEPVISDDYNDSDYVYDSEDNLTAVNITCKGSNGASIQLTTDNKYQSGSDYGTYTIIRDSIVPVTSSDGTKKVLYYDGVILADGTTIYDCGEAESTTE